MKKQTLLTYIVSACFAFAGETELPTTTVQAFELPQIETAASYTSENVWRGVAVTDASAALETRAQHEVFEEFTVSLDAFAATSDTGTDEFIGTLRVSKEYANTLFGINYAWYSRDFDRTHGSAQEVGFSLSRMVGPVYLTLTQYLAVQGDNDGYADVRAAYSTDFGKLPFVLDFSSELGVLTEKQKLNHAMIKVSTDIAIIDGYIVSPFIASSAKLSTVDGSVFADTSNLFYGGIVIKRSF
jgi:hypothetical protein